jgi:putative DNA primase/helicase
MAEFLRQAVEAGNRSAEKFAKDSLNDWRISAMLRSVQADLEVDPGDLDANPWMLNFEDGTFDLKDGIFREHRREDLITKLAHCSYDPEAKAPTFQKVLNHVTGGSKDLLEYLQQVLGYALTGSTAEKAFFVVYGLSGTGKTTLLNAVRQTFEEYSCSIQIETLMAARDGLSNNQQSDLADLKGARFAQTSEVESGQRLKEGLVKRLTQGTSTIKAARKFQEHIEFKETHKLFIDANYRPEIRSDGIGTYERLHCIPFTHVLDPSNQDINVHAKLEAERAGIAAWVIGGALAWMRAGRLVKPPQVLRANDEYRASQDEMGEWLEERCIISPEASVRCSQLLESYNQFVTTGGGSRGLDARKFKERLLARQEGFIYGKSKDKARVYFGVMLKPDFEAVP